MTTLRKLLRRTTAAALCAIAALTVPGVATAQGTVTLSSGASCVYSGMTISPNGNVSVTCGSQTSPGNLSIVGPASLATGTPYTTQIGVSRTGGSTGSAEVDWTIDAVLSTNGCVSSDGTNTITTGHFSWADAESQTRIIPIQTGPNSGACVIKLANETGAAVGTASRTKSMNVVNGNDPVTFTLAATTSSTTVQGAGVNITVTRAGGPSNAWTVPVSLSGGLTASGNLIVGGGSLSKTTLSFPAGASSDSIVYTPPASAPATPALPSTLQLILGTPVDPIPADTQTGSIVGTNTHTLTLNPAPVQGCDTTSADVAIGWGSTPTVALLSGQVGSYVVPTSVISRKVSGQWILSTTTSGPSDSYTGTFQVEAHISKCKGVITVPTGNDPCYVASTTRAQPISGNLHHMFQTTATLNTPAAIAAAGACYTPASDGPWYINLRYTYAPGACLGTCGYKLTAYPWSY